MSAWNFKFTYDGVIRRVSAPVNAGGMISTLSYEVVRQLARDLYGISSDLKMSLTYVDEEGDQVTLSSDLEFTEFIRIMERGRQALLKVGIVTTDESSSKASLTAETPVIHEGVSCDGCGMSPIQGLRFKCAVRDNYDLCSACESKTLSHQHPMLKVYAPDAGAMVRYRSGHFKRGKCWMRNSNEGCTRGESLHVGNNRGFNFSDAVTAVAEVASAFSGELEEQISLASRNKAPNGSSSAEPNVTQKSSDPSNLLPIHEKVTCDGCGTKPIVGYRFKCTVRDDFDLCAACEANLPQPYPMLKIYNPDIDVRIKGWQHGPGWRRGCPVKSWGKSISCPVDQTTGRRVRCPVAGSSDSASANAPQPNSYSTADEYDKLVLDEVIRSSMIESSSPGNIGAGEEKSENLTKKSISETVVATPIIAANLSVNQIESIPEVVVKSAFNQAALKGYALKPMARFVGDITVPDFSILAPSTDFIKIWLVRNDGPCQWPEGVHLVTAGGDPMCPANLVVPVETIAVGEETRVSVTLKTPPAPGRYVSYFKLMAPDGTIFGQKLWADVRVQVTGGSALPGAFTSPAFSVKPATTAKDEVGLAPPKEAHVPTVKALPIARFPDSTESSAISQENICVASPANVDAAKVSSDESATIQTPGLSAEDMQWITEKDSLEMEWKVELDALRAMGFHDSRENISLLKLHVKCSYNRFPHLHGKPFNDALSTILDALLNCREN